jgi:hypothetical protein
MEERVRSHHKHYLCTKHSWNNRTFNDIAWEYHRRALNQHQPKRTILTKYVNGITPVGKMVNRYDKKYALNCPSCAEQIETQDHLLICPNPKREKWRTETRAQIRTIMNKYNAPTKFTDLMIGGIDQAILDPNTKGPENTPAELETIAAAQQRIGWRHILKGRISKEWIKYLELRIGDAATKTKNAGTWATELIKTIFTQWLELWKLRNDDRHGHDYKTKQESERNQALKEVQQLYKLKGQIQAEDEWIFHTPWEQQQLNKVKIRTMRISE